MKIIEKKCPNCGANLDFQVGERDIQCKSCRRKYAVEYGDVDFDQLNKEAVDALKAADIDLRPARRLAVLAIIIFFAILTVAGIISVININNSRRDFDQEVEQSQREFEQKSQDMKEESQREYEQRVKEMQESVEKF